MADVIHRTTLEFRRSVSTPDFPEPTWKHNPNMSGVDGVEQKYWKAPPTWVGDVGPLEMTAPEKAVVDAAELAASKVGARSDSVANVDVVGDAVGVELRAIIEVFNKRDNYLVNRIAELQQALDAVKASSGAAQNIRDAIPANWLATNTRPRPDAVQDYKDEINAGNVDEP